MLLFSIDLFLLFFISYISNLYLSFYAWSFSYLLICFYLYRYICVFLYFYIIYIYICIIYTCLCMRISVCMHICNSMYISCVLRELSSLCNFVKDFNFNRAWKALLIWKNRSLAKYRKNVSRKKAFMKDSYVRV